jgi:spoIIIJ-associated protein
MRTVESEGSSIDAAIARALASLGVDRDQVEIEILTNAQRGLLGIGRTKARVRATIRVPVSVALRDLGLDGADAPEVPTASPAAIADSADRRSRAVAGQGSDPVDAARTLGEIVRLMGLDAEVAPVESGPGEWILDIQGAAAVDLVGHHGEVLDALEYVVNRIVERSSDGAPVVVDADGFRSKRIAHLEAMAHRLASRVRRKRKPVTLKAMSPGDRRALHGALKAEGGVSARSIGQGFYRKLMIIPEGRGGGDSRAE